MRIKTRLLLLLIPAIFVSFGLLAALGYLNSSKQARNLAEAEARGIALEQSGILFDTLRQAEAATLSLASTLLQFQRAGNVDREALSLAVKGSAASSGDFFGVWALWEANAYDGKDADYVDNEDFGNADGRANAYWRQEKGTLIYEPSEDFDIEHYYTLPKQTGKLTIIPPYRDMDTPEKTLMSSMTMPIMDKGRPLGVVGIDIELEFLQGLIRKITPYETGYAMLVSDKGAIIAGPDGGGSDKADLPLVSETLRGKLREGKAFSVAEPSRSGEKEQVQSFYTPVSLDSFERPWFFVVSLPMDKVMASSNRSLLIQLGISLTALAVLVGLVFYTAQGVSRPLRRIADYAQRVAAGEHGASLDGRGFVLELRELRAALVSMMESLMAGMRLAEQRNEEARQEAEKANAATAEAEKAREISENNHRAMREIAARVDAVSGKLQETSHELTEKIAVAGHETEEQNKLMAETVVSISGMADSIVMVSDNAGDAAQATQRAQERAREGAEIVDKTLSAFDGIRREAEALGSQIEDLGSRTEAIGGILDMINDIADQTNLLALNAAIEAARAGDAGRGFAVVADEVRKLAEKTVQATKQVEESVNGIRSSMSVSAQGVTRTMETVQATVSLGHEAQASLGDIVNLVRGMSEQINDIARLCKEQASTGEQVGGIVDRLRQISLVVGEAMDESAAIARALEPEAQELGLLVDQLSKT